MGGYGTRTPAGILIPSGFAIDDAFDPLDLSPVAYFEAGRSRAWTTSAEATLVTAATDPWGSWENLGSAAVNAQQATDANRAVAVAYGSYLVPEFDGTDDFLQALYALNQPFTRVSVLKQRTFTNGDHLYGGGSGNGGVLYQTGASPTITMYSGSNGPQSTGLIVDTWTVLAEVFNGASSTCSVNGGAATTGDTGATNKTGIAFGAAFDGSGPSALTCAAVVEWAGTNAADIARTVQYFGSKFGITVA